MKKWNGAVFSLIAALLSLFTKVNSNAQIVITVGNYNLLPNTAGQTIDFFVSNVGSAPVSVSGLDFQIQVADSGPASKSGLGSEAGPDITNVDIITGTIFASNNTGNTNAGSIFQYANYTTTTSSGSVSIDPSSTSKLATVTFSTVGFVSPQTWVLRLAGTIDNSTHYFSQSGASVIDVPATIQNGTISVVPEPVHITLVGSLVFLFAVGRSVNAARRPEEKVTDSRLRVVFGRIGCGPRPGTD